MPKLKLREFLPDKILEQSSGPGSPLEVYTQNIHTQAYYGDIDTGYVTPDYGVGSIAPSTTVPGTDSSGSLPVSGEITDGLMSFSNGMLASSNFCDDFKISPDHIMPEQAVMARMDGMRQTSTFYGNGVGQRTHGNNTSEWVTVPGATLRWYQPYATTVSMMHWDLFLSWNNWQGEYYDVIQTYAKNGRKTKIELRCMLDGEYVDYSRRRLGENFFHPVSPGAPYCDAAYGPGLSRLTDPPDKIRKHEGGNPKYVWPEAHSAVPFSWHHASALSKGFHEIGLQVKVTRISGKQVYVQNIGTESRSSTIKGRGYFELMAKISMGIRNARVVSFL